MLREIRKLLKYSDVLEIKPIPLKSMTSEFVLGKLSPRGHLIKRRRIQHRRRVIKQNVTKSKKQNRTITKREKIHVQIRLLKNAFRWHVVQWRVFTARSFDKTKAWNANTHLVNKGGFFFRHCYRTNYVRLNSGITQYTYYFIKY